jgi:hypothetical protein
MEMHYVGNDGEFSCVRKANLLFYVHTWSDNEVHELIAVKVIHTSLLNVTVVAFKVLPLGSYALMLVPSPDGYAVIIIVGMLSHHTLFYYNLCVYSRRISVRSNYDES